jgi:UDP-N-acetylmuramate--alanine ligase
MVERTLVVLTPAIPSDHKEWAWFREQGFTIEKRSQMLGVLSEGKCVMAVAGTHGKTTTSTLASWLNYAVAGEGSAFLGGISRNFNSNLVLGEGRRLVVEADEYDRSFLRLYPDVAVITATDADHLDIYGTPEAMVEAFEQFASQIKPGGALILKQGVDLKFDVSERMLYRYSCDAGGDFHAENISLQEGGYYNYDIVLPDGRVEGCTLGILGTRLCPTVEQAVEEYTAETGDSNIDTLRFEEQNASVDGLAADWHPTEKTNTKAATKLVSKIKKMMDWK